MTIQQNTLSQVVPAASLSGASNFPASDILLDQPASIVDTESYSTQDFETANDSNDIFHGDDFINTRPWRIGKIFIPGNTFNNSCDLDIAESLELAIYLDENGKPDGYPDGGLGSGGNVPVWNISLSPDDVQVTLSDGTDGFTSNLTVVLKAPVHLDPGHYWLIFYPKMSYSLTTCQYGRHVADSESGVAAQVINPGEGLYLPADWTSIQDSNTWNLDQQDLAFTLARPPFPWVMFYPAIQAGRSRNVE